MSQGVALGCGTVQALRAGNAEAKAEHPDTPFKAHLSQDAALECGSLLPPC